MAMRAVFRDGSTVPLVPDAAGVVQQVSEGQRATAVTCGLDLVAFRQNPTPKTVTLTQARYQVN